MYKYSKGWFVNELRKHGILVHPQLKKSFRAF